MLAVLALALVALTYAAPPIVPVEFAPCVDGVNNVIQMADVNDGPLTIRAQDVAAYTYDDKGRPSCHNGRAAVSLPGQIKLAKGQVVVSAANANIKSAEMKMTVRKNSIFIGYVCNNGKRQKRQVPEKVCHHSIYPDLPEHFLNMLSTPGTYDLETIEKEAHQTNIIKLPRISGGLNMIVKGDWQVQMSIELGGHKIAHVKLPSNTPWLYVN